MAFAGGVARVWRASRHLHIAPPALGGSKEYIHLVVWRNIYIQLFDGICIFSGSNSWLAVYSSIETILLSQPFLRFWRLEMVSCIVFHNTSYSIISIVFIVAMMFILCMLFRKFRIFLYSRSSCFLNVLNKYSIGNVHTVHNAHNIYSIHIIYDIRLIYVIHNSHKVHSVHYIDIKIFLDSQDL